jgi:hypothetical protein
MEHNFFSKHLVSASISCWCSCFSDLFILFWWYFDNPNWWYCSACHDITEIQLKLALNTKQLINIVLRDILPLSFKSGLVNTNWNNNNNVIKTKIQLFIAQAEYHRKKQAFNKQQWIQIYHSQLNINKYYFKSLVKNIKKCTTIKLDF